METEDAAEFVRMVSEAWQPPLNDTQEALWIDMVLPLDGKLAFTILMRLFKSEAKRPDPPSFKTVYKRELIDKTPLVSSVPEDRDEIPEWVLGWRLARSEGDERAWPDEEVGAKFLHERWLYEYGEAAAKRRMLTNGHEWDAFVAERGMTPSDDRLEYIRRAKAGEGPRTAEEILGLSG